MNNNNNDELIQSTRALSLIDNINVIDDINNEEPKYDNINEWWENIEFPTLNQKIPIKIDCGSSQSILTLESVVKLNIKEEDIIKRSRRFYTYTNQQIESIGQINLQVKLRYKNESVNFEILDCERNLLGLKECKKFNLINIDEIESENNIINKYKDVFEGIGRFKDEYKINLLDQNITIFEVARKIPQMLEGKVKEKLNAMVKANIIKKVENPGKIINAMVITEKKNGDIRICLDPRKLNKYIVFEKTKIPTIDEIKIKLRNKKDQTQEMNFGKFHYAENPGKYVVLILFLAYTNLQ